MGEGVAASFVTNENFSYLQTVSVYHWKCYLTEVIIKYSIRSDQCLTLLIFYFQANSSPAEMSLPVITTTCKSRMIAVDYVVKLTEAHLLVLNGN